VILASPRAIYRAYLDPEMVASWRPPEGMRAEIFSFEGRLGGTYEMAFHYERPAAVEGKSGSSVDRFSGEFVELIPDEKIVERIRFMSDDPIFSQPMIITTSLRAVKGGTKVAVLCENVPAAISSKDHVQGMTSSLRNLAMLTE
jgi:uncharacterized protein YndB with AHSA1/START domain